MRQAFRQEEAEQILTEAARRSVAEEHMALSNPEVSDERLRAMAEKLGISEGTLSKVLREREEREIQEQTVAQEQTTLATERAAFLTHRRAEFFQDLWSYIGVSLLLTGIWALDGAHGDFWPKWVMFFWVIGLFYHGVSAFSKGGKDFDKDWERWRRKRQRRANRAEARERRRNED